MEIVQRTDCSASEEIASCKVMQIPESGKFLLVESGSGIPQTIVIQNPSSTDKELGIQ